MIYYGKFLSKLSKHTSAPLWITAEIS